MEYYLNKKEILSLQQMDESGSHYGKWNKLGKERQILYDLTHMWNLKMLIS
jgi:hypothetical protein